MWKNFNFKYYLLYLHEDACFVLLIELPSWLCNKESTCNAEDHEKEMATHSSLPAWKIPWTEEPGWLQSMASQRVGYNWAHTYLSEN